MSFMLRYRVAGENSTFLISCVLYSKVGDAIQTGRDAAQRLVWLKAEQVAGRRHHTIPDFLLRAFASSVRGDECKVWMYRRGSVGVELNTKNVSVERDFYGRKDESDLDDSITTLESEYAPLVNDNRDCQGVLRDERVPRMVAHLSLRTRSLRQSAIGLATWMVDTVRQDVVQPEVLKAAVQNKFGKGELTRMIRKELASRGVGRVQIEKLLPALLSQMVPVVEGEMDRIVAEGTPQLDQEIQAATKQLPVSIREHSIDALSRNVGGGARGEAYSQFNWFILHIG